MQPPRVSQVSYIAPLPSAYNSKTTNPLHTRVISLYHFPTRCQHVTSSQFSRSFLPGLEHWRPHTRRFLWLWLVWARQLRWWTYHTCCSLLLWLLDAGWNINRCTEALQPSNSVEICLVGWCTPRRTGHSRRSRWHWVWSRRWHNWMKHPISIPCARWPNHGPT